MFSTLLFSLLLLSPGPAPVSGAAQQDVPAKAAQGQGQGQGRNQDQTASKRKARRPAPRNLEIVPNAEMLPGDAMVVGVMAPIRRHRVDILKTGIQDLLDWLGPEWQEQPSVASLVLGPIGLESLTKSGFSLAVSSAKGSKKRGKAPQSLRWILIAPTVQAAKLRNELAEARKDQTEAGHKISSQEIGADTAWFIRTRKGLALSYMITEDAVLLGDSIASVKGAIEQLDDVDSSFAAAPAYGRYARRVRKEGAPLATVIVQPPKIIEHGLGFLQNPAARRTVRKLCQKLDLTRVQEIGVSFFAKDGQLRDFVWIGYPGPRQGLLASIVESRTRVDVDQLRPIAPDTVSATLFTMNGRRVSEEAQEFAKLLHQSFQDWLDTKRLEFKSRSGLDLLDHIVPLLGSRGVLQEWAPEGLTRAMSLTIALDDTNNMRRALNIFARRMQLDVAQIDSVPALVLPFGLDPNSKTLLTVSGRTLVLTTTRRAMRRVITMLESKASVKTQKLAELVGAMGSMPNHFTWGDCGEISRHWLNSLSKTLGHRLLARELHQVVRARAGSIASWIETDAHGIAIRSQSPFGNLYLTLSATYAIKQLVFRGETAQTLDARRRAVVRDLVAAQHEYQRRAFRDRDGDHIGEFGSIHQLLDSGLVTSRWFSDTSKKTVVGENYRFRVFTPPSTDRRETAFLLLAWPTPGTSGDAFAATSDGSIYRNEIIGQTSNLQKCDPRDFYDRGAFGEEILPSWNLVETSMVSTDQETSERNRELTYQETEALDAITAAEDIGEVTPTVLKLLGSDSAFIVSRAAFLLGNLRHKEAVPQLCEIVREHTNAEVKRQALAALAKIRDPQSIPASIEALGSSDPTLRTLAAENLGYLHAKKAMRKLIEVLSRDPRPDAPDRVAALLALADIGNPACLLPAAVRVKAGGKDDEKSLVYLFQTLSRKLPETREVETLMAVLDDDSEILRRFAIQRLGVLAHPIAERALRERLEKEKNLHGLIEVSLRAIASGRTSDRLKGYVTNATAKGEELWYSLPANIAYLVGGSLILGFLVFRRVKRQRRLQKRGAYVAAMAAPSEDFATDEDDYLDDNYEAPFHYADPEALEEGGFEDGHASDLDNTAEDDDTFGAGYDEFAFDSEEPEGGRYYGDDPLDDFYSENVEVERL